MEKRSQGLTVLCILSWVWLAIVLYGYIGEWSTGKLTEEDMRLQRIALIESQTPETLAEMGWILDDMDEMMIISSNNYSIMMGLNLAGLIIGILAVMLMFKQRKLGFHLYIIYTLLSMFYWVYFFSGIDFALVFIVWSIVIGGLFIWLYSRELKQMA